MNELTQRRYLAAAHAVQTGVKTEHEMGSDDGSPKHLRVGILTTKCETGALARLLVERGIITEDEYLAAVTEFLEEAVAEYRDRISEAMGFPVKLT